ncbi:MULTISPECIES: penicillin-binding transpeptidase domain-containing protein [Isoptericola]|uniref:penicillin-binding transpeptidase domain-containing protein n=1 Tax=Isoptericola TaxID=254250 RepID=UPI001FAFEF3D|nr:MULTISPECIES: penicillin-binding transpeptidase domain-containing protein [Isoptericola]
MRRRTTFTVTALLSPAVVLALAACTGADRPPASDAADTLATALASLDLTGVPVATSTSADPQAHLVEVTEPLVEVAEAAGVEPTVTVAEVTEVDEGSDDAPPAAEVTLAWTWPLDGDRTWEYTTTTELVWVAPPEGSEEPGTWETQWDTDLAVPGLAAGERLAIDELPAERGDILDVDGEPLVTERDVYRVGIDKTRIASTQWAAQARRLGKMIWTDPADYVARVEAAGDKAFVEAITVRQEDPGIDFSVGRARGIEGVNVISDTMELAPTSSFALPILGRSGEATAEIIEESDGEVVAGDVVGLSGLQRDYDEQLRGADGLVVSAVPSEGDAEDGEEPRELYRVEPTEGADVGTTFDPALQVLAEETLAGVEPASAIVAIRPSTGDVLAAASGPGSEGWSTATLGQYAPGSTFKVATALALLRADTFPEDTVECPETITVNGRTYSNVPGYPASATGEVSFATAFAHSCNTAFIGTAEAVTQAELAAAGADLGLGTSTRFDRTPVFTGSVPDEASQTGHAESVIGQGKVLASPVGMATVAASVAAGERVEPRIVRSVTDAEGAEVDTSAEPEASADASAEAPEDGPAGDGLTETEAADLLDLMGGVVTDGSASVLADVPDVVGAKTGTAQYGDGSRQHAWMLAVADDLAVAVFVEDGEYGSTTAGPLMERFLAGR